MKFPKVIGGVKWPIWNRRNLVVTTGCGLLALVAFGHAASPTTATSAAPKPTTSVTAQPAPQTAPAYTPDPTTPPTTNAPGDVHLDMNATATAFATAWARPKLTRAKWQAGIGPWVTPALAKAMSTTDPARVPATRVIGDPMLEKYADRWAWAWIRVTTDGGDIIVSVVSTPVGLDGQRSWLVSNVQPADPAPTAAPTHKGAK